MAHRRIRKTPEERSSGVSHLFVQSTVLQLVLQVLCEVQYRESSSNISSARKSRLPWYQNIILLILFARFVEERICHRIFRTALASS